ncbi:unnamed protein product [Musa acuminata var. zebrina]
MTHVSDIKLIRTDTTLDLSQKAEKGTPATRDAEDCLYLVSELESIGLYCCLAFFGVRQARAVVQRMGDARGPRQQATVVGSPPQEINLISWWIDDPRIRY